MLELQGSVAGDRVSGALLKMLKAKAVLEPLEDLAEWRRLSGWGWGLHAWLHLGRC